MVMDLMMDLLNTLLVYMIHHDVIIIRSARASAFLYACGAHPLAPSLKSERSH